MLRDFFLIVRLLAAAGQWQLLAIFFELIRDLRKPELFVTVGNPTDKEV